VLKITLCQTLIRVLAVAVKPTLHKVLYGKSVALSTDFRQKNKIESVLSKRTVNA